MLAIYVIAMIATTWHFAYGIWLFAAKWGITPGEKARKTFGYICAVVGIALCLMGLASMYAFVGMDKYKNAPEDVMPEQPAAVSRTAPVVPMIATDHSQQVEVR
jgi:succinate dehydrogenase / fumarate reductase cytochrome b subunit